MDQFRWARSWRLDIVLTVAGQPSVPIAFRELVRPASSQAAAADDLAAAIDGVIAKWKAADAPALAAIEAAQHQAASEPAPGATPLPAMPSPVDRKVEAAGLDPKPAAAAAPVSPPAVTLTAGTPAVTVTIEQLAALNTRLHELLAKA
jgi:hypothetical protein